MNPNHVLLRSLLTKQGWRAHDPELVQLALAQDTNARAIYGHLERLHELVDGPDVSPVDLEVYLRNTQMDPQRADDLVASARAVHEIPAPTPEVVMASTRDAIRRGLALQAVKHVVETHTSPTFDPTPALQFLQQAQDLRADSKPPVVALADTGLPDLANDRPNMCSLALSPKLDEACGGGVAAGELLVFLGGPKRGKTAILSAIGANAAKQGKHVLHVTLEISSQLAARRYDAALSGLNYQEMLRAPEMVERARRELAGTVDFVDWQYEEHSPSDLRPILAWLREAGRPTDLLIVDYLQLMIPDRTKAMARQEQRHLYDRLGKDMRGMAKYAAIPVVTAWQVNRLGSASDVTEATDIAESWAIPAHVDILIGLSRSSEERSLGQLNVHTILQRFNSTVKNVKFQVDFGRTKFTEVL